MYHKRQAAEANRANDAEDAFMMLEALKDQIGVQDFLVPKEPGKKKIKRAGDDFIAGTKFC